MVRFWLAAPMLLAAAPAGAEDSRPGDWTAPEVREFSDWSVACDNARDCAAVSVSREYVARLRGSDPGDYASPKLWVRRAAGPGARARVFVDTRVWGEADKTGELALHVYRECDGDCTGRAFRLVRIESGRYELAGDQIAAFLAESAATDRAATRRPDGEMHGIITTTGMIAALRYIDDAQERRGTVTALYARGPRPASAVPPAPRRETVRAVRGEEVDFGGKALPFALAQLRREHCPGLNAPSTAGAQRFRLASGQMLWSVPCNDNLHDPKRLWLIETRTGAVELHRFPRPEQGRPAALPVLPNSQFDPATGQITAYSGGMCGWRRRWAWTGSAFAMIDAIEMPACIDILPAQWLQTYRAMVQ